MKPPLSCAPKIYSGVHDNVNNRNMQVMIATLLPVHFVTNLYSRWPMPILSPQTQHYRNKVPNCSFPFNCWMSKFISIFLCKFLFMNQALANYRRTVKSTVSLINIPCLFLCNNFYEGVQQTRCCNSEHRSTNHFMDIISLFSVHQ